jgi:hypothetical protein
MPKTPTTATLPDSLSRRRPAPAMGGKKTSQTYTAITTIDTIRIQLLHYFLYLLTYVLPFLALGVCVMFLRKDAWLAVIGILPLVL